MPYREESHVPSYCEDVISIKETSKTGKKGKKAELLWTLYSEVKGLGMVSINS